MQGPFSKHWSRREFGRGMLGLMSCLPLADLLSFAADKPSNSAARAVSDRPALSPEDDDFLNEIEKATFQYFWDQGNPKIGKRSMQHSRQRCQHRRQHGGYGFWSDRYLYWPGARFHSVGGRA